MENTHTPPKLLDQIRQHCAASGYSPRTAQAYAHWAACFVRANGLQHPRELGKAEAVAWLATLAQPGGSKASQAAARPARRKHGRRWCFCIGGFWACPPCGWMKSPHRACKRLKCCR